MAILTCARLAAFTFILFPVQAHASQVSVSRSEILGCIGSGGACLKPAKVLPYTEAGKVIGWKLTQVEKSKALARLGLKENDVIVSANGEDVTDSKRVAHWVLELLSIQSLDLGILRRGHSQQLKLRISE